MGTSGEGEKERSKNIIKEIMAKNLLNLRSDINEHLGI